jgi:replicative DNA helicase
LLGAILANNGVFDRCDAIGFKAEHFADALHGRIYDAVSRLREAGRTANPVTLKTLFDQDGALSEIGGAQYLVDLAQSVVTVINADDYARVIMDHYQRREIIALAHEMEARAKVADVPGESRALGAEFEARLALLSEVTAEQRPAMTAYDAAYVALEQAERAMKCEGLTGLTTGLRDLDQMLGGLHPGLIVMAARPSMGKTTLACNIGLAASKALAAAKGDAAPVVLFYSHEMSAVELGMKFIAEKTGISTDRQRSGDLKLEDLSRMVETGAEFHGLPFLIDDSAKATPQAMATRARRLHRKRGVALIITDHLQLIEADEHRESSVQRMTAITRALKMLSKELNVPLLALSQLSRKVEERDDKRPQLADLRESGSIEQDADAVWMLYRPEYYLQQPTKKQGETPGEFEQRGQEYSAELSRVANTCEILVRKNRLGRTGMRRVYCDLEAGRFSDLARGG